VIVNLIDIVDFEYSLYGRIYSCSKCSKDTELCLYFRGLLGWWHRYQMGRTIPSFRIALAMEKQEWKPFSQCFRKKDRKTFDEMWDSTRLYLSGCSNFHFFLFLLNNTHH